MHIEVLVGDRLERFQVLRCTLKYALMSFHRPCMLELRCICLRYGVTGADNHGILTLKVSPFVIRILSVVRLD